MTSKLKIVVSNLVSHIEKETEFYNLCLIKEILLYFSTGDNMLQTGKSSSDTHNT